MPRERALMSVDASRQLFIRESCRGCPLPEPVGTRRYRCPAILWSLVCEPKFWNAYFRLLLAEHAICSRYVYEHSGLDGTPKSGSEDVGGGQRKLRQRRETSIELPPP